MSALVIATTVTFVTQQNFAGPAVVYSAIVEKKKPKKEVHRITPILGEHFHPQGFFILLRRLLNSINQRVIKFTK
jgi:hypothetical protein